MKTAAKAFSFKPSITLLEWKSSKHIRLKPTTSSMMYSTSETTDSQRTPANPHTHILVSTPPLCNKCSHFCTHTHTIVNGSTFIISKQNHIWHCEFKGCCHGLFYLKDHWNGGYLQICRNSHLQTVKLRMSSESSKLRLSYIPTFPPSHCNEIHMLMFLFLLQIWLQHWTGIVVFFCPFVFTFSVLNS